MTNITHAFDALVLLTSVPSETSILSKYSIYNIQTFILKYCVSNLSLYEPFSKNVLQKFFLFSLTTDLMSIITLWIVNIFSIYKDLHESILISPKL